jgi:hypothetical protein
MELGNLENFTDRYAQNLNVKILKNGIDNPGSGGRMTWMSDTWLDHNNTEYTRIYPVHFSAYTTWLDMDNYLLLRFVICIF